MHAGNAQTRSSVWCRNPIKHGPLAFSFPFTSFHSAPPPPQTTHKKPRRPTASDSYLRRSGAARALFRDNAAALRDSTFSRLLISRCWRRASRPPSLFVMGLALARVLSLICKLLPITTSVPTFTAVCRSLNQKSTYYGKSEKARAAVDRRLHRVGSQDVICGPQQLSLFLIA